MTSTNFTIDNINPLIQYTPAAAWSEGNKATDPLALSYSNNGTFTLCTTQGSSASYIFNGTQVYVFGAKRENHGPYSVNLDGISTPFNGFSADAIFGTLFVSDVLKQGLHTVTVTNELNDTTKPFLDIDFITWTTTVPDRGVTATVEDTAANFAYQPSTSWNTDLASSLLTGFSGNNGHVTLTAGASVLITFAGEYITVFGPVGPSISRYTVKVDGEISGTFNGTKEAYTPQVALYHADGLSAGQHTIELISQPAVNGQVFAVDFVQIDPASASSTSTATSGGSSSTTSSTTGAKSSLGAVVGGVVAGVLVLLVLLLILLFLRRRKRRREQEPMQISLEDKYPPPLRPTTNFTTTSFTGAPSQMSPYPTPGSEMHGSELHGSEMHGSEIHLMPAPYRDAVPAAPLTNPWGGSQSQPDVGQRRTFYTVNNDAATSESGSNATSSLRRSSTLFSAGAAGLGAGGYTSRKGAPLPMPPTANVPLPPGAERMHVPGREQDFGPLPPAYEQAVEPYEGYS
ncbi:hypothetical protein C8R44DRAFT_689877 [Mycena epipterygia]|nr:hypothetical protein C8R44DRAFT_689877 [Mycena epipterygia]